jgi:hypothetical protein
MNYEGSQPDLLADIPTTASLLEYIPTDEQIGASDHDALVGALRGRNVSWRDAVDANDLRGADNQYAQADRIGSELARRASHKEPDTESRPVRNVPQGLREQGVFHRIGDAVMRIANRNGS